MVPPNGEQRIVKLWRDVYEGDGPSNPSLTTRMARTEDRVLLLEQNNQNRSKSLETKMNLVLATLLGLLATIILKMVFHI